MFLYPFAQRCLLPLFIVIYGLFSLYVMTVFIPGSNFLSDNNSHDHVLRPYSYRVLVPATTRLFVFLTPDMFRQEVTPLLIALRDSDFFSRIIAFRTKTIPLLLSNERIFETSINLVVIYVTLLAFIWMLYTLAKALMPDSQAYALVAPLVALLLIPVFAFWKAYTYDFAEMFFSCACFYCLLKRRWRSYFLCLAAATLNKETSLLVIFFYLLWFFPRLPRKQYVAIGGLQLLVYGLIKGGITLYYAGTPGAFAAHYFEENILYLYGYNYTTFVCLAISVCLVGYRWHEKPEFLRGGLWMLPPNFIAYFVACKPGEYRDLYWSMPILILLATHTLIRITVCPADGKCEAQA